MDTDKMGTTERHLAERLRTEAAADRPEFSEPLHEQICRAAFDAKTTALELPPATRTRQYRWLSALAAAGMVAVALSGWWLTRPDVPDPVERPPIASVPGPVTPDKPAVDPLEGLASLTTATGQKAGEVGLLVDATLSVQKWAHLDQDARTATRLLLDHLPFETEQP